jgi:glucose/arabinose dehydrogenase
MRRLVSVSLALAAALAGCAEARPAAGGQKVYSLLGERFIIEDVATDLYVPWAVAWLPDGRMIATQRRGDLGWVDASTKTVRPLAYLAVDSGGEHGLMSVAVSHRFAEDSTIVVSYTARTAGGQRVNRIQAMRLSDQGITPARVLVDNLPAADYHDGLPLRFGPDGALYASTGDAGDGKLAQRPDSLAGKFLRINLDGTIPPDNPLPQSPVWSLGHRNCQGFDFQAGSRRLYATEHGPSVPVDSLIGGGDELNLVLKGGNYGWPLYHHDKNAPGFVAPLKTWTPAIAPSGACFYSGKAFPKWDGCFFFAALQGKALYCTRFGGDDGRNIELLMKVIDQDLGRLRAVAVGPDGYLYLTTSNRDGRGKAAPGDDRIVRLVPARER